jgi:hypothetical protein
MDVPYLITIVLKMDSDIKVIEDVPEGVGVLSTYRSISASFLSYYKVPGRVLD